MKVAFLTHEPFYPPSGGGSAEALYLVQELVGRGHSVHLFCPTIQNPREVEKDFGIKLHEFHTWQMGRYTSLRSAKYLAYPFFLQRLVAAEAKTNRFDMILSQHAISAVAAGMLKKRLRIPIVMNFLDYLTGFMETWPPYLAPPQLLSRLEKFEVGLPKRYQADGVLTVSDTLADYFSHAGYPQSRIKPIYYGYDSELFQFRAPAAQPPENPVVVMHGSFDHHHLREIGLHGIEQASQVIPGAVFRFVGHRTSALNSFLERLKELAPKAKVECTGFVPYAQVAKHLASADLGIVPYEESTGTHCAFVAKIVEYLGTGLRVVSTPLDSAQRYFRDEPMVRFTEFNGPSFGRQIVESLQSPLPNQAEAARTAAERVKRELDWRAISRKAVDFVEEARRAAL